MRYTFYMTVEAKSGKNKQRLVLLDAHAIIHRAYHALPEFSSSKGEPTGALYGLTAILIKIVNDLKPDWIIAAYDLPKPTYRHEVYKEYKAGRAKADEELVAQLKRSRDLLAALSIPIYDKEGFEADDILGTIVEKLQATSYKLQADIIIASGDMDTLQLVDDKKVQVYTLKRGISDTIIYDEAGVLKRFGFPPKLLPDYKGLCGDPSDNIVGVKGIGDKTATTLIQKFGTVENLYKTLKKGDELLLEAGVKERIIKLLKENKEEAEFSKILATIRRDAPIDFKLPEKRWAEAVDIKNAEQFFADLEFRTMGQRLRQALTYNLPLATGESNKLGNFVSKPNLETKFPSMLSEKLPAASSQLQASSVMLWLLNSSLTNPSWDDIRAYTRKDTAEEALKYLSGEIKKQELTRLYEDIEAPLIPVVNKMNARGVAVDTKYLGALGKEYSAALKKLEEKIWKIAGGRFNVASPKQLGEVLFIKLGLKAKNQKKTPGGALSTKESELAKLADSHPIVPLILEHRELAKLLSTYIDNTIPLVGPDGRLRAKFLQAGTTTGRMASEEPNLQNIPVHSELGKRIRNAFIAEKGNILASFDYSQIELRIAAFLSGDKELIRIFKEGKDVHAAVAAAVFGVPMEKVDKEMRRRAKVINFGVMYGMGVNALQKNLGSNRAEAQKFYDDYFKTFSGLAEYLDKVKVETAKRGYTETIFGRRRYFEGINSLLPYIKAAAERMAVNAPIQGTEADIIKLAMVRADKWLSEQKLDDKVFLVLQVHDELVYEVKKEVVSKIAPEIKKIMENVLPPSETKGVPVVVDVSAGENWGQMEKMRT
jgi:DNA polymerase-1